MTLTPIKNAYLVEGASSAVPVPPTARAWTNLDTMTTQLTGYMWGRDFNSGAATGAALVTLGNPSITGNVATDPIMIYSIPITSPTGIDGQTTPVVKATFGYATYQMSVNFSVSGTSGTTGTSGQLTFNIPAAAWVAGLLVEVQLASEQGTTRLGYYWQRNSTATPPSNAQPVDHYAYPAAAALGNGSVLLSYAHVGDAGSGTTTTTTTGSWDTSWKVNGTWTTGSTRSVRASMTTNGPADVTITVYDPVPDPGGGWRLPYDAVPDGSPPSGTFSGSSMTWRGAGNISGTSQQTVVVGTNQYWLLPGVDQVELSFFLYVTPFISDIQLFTLPAGALTSTTTTPTAPTGFAAYTTKTNVLTLADDEYTAGRQIDLPRPRILASTLAPTTGNRVLALYEAEADDTASGGYQLLTVDNDVASVADIEALPAPGRYTIKSSGTAVLAGNDTFFVHRVTSLTDGTQAASSPQASIDLVTVIGATLTRTPVADALDPATLLGVVPIDATTAYAGAVTATGGLRMYRLTTSGAITTTDLTLPLLTQTPIYAGVNGEYPVEIVTSGAISGTLTRYGIRYTGSAFTATQLPLDQIDRTLIPPGVTPTSMSTRLDSAAYVPAGDQLFVVRYATTGLTEDTWLRISQYDGTSGVLVAEAWSGGVLANGQAHSNLTSTPPAVFYDADKAQLGVAVMEWRAAYATNAIRVATFQIEGFKLAEQLRSQATNFL